MQKRSTQTCWPPPVEADEEEVVDILAAVESIHGVKKPTVKKFKRELAKIRGKGETFV